MASSQKGKRVEFVPCDVPPLGPDSQAAALRQRSRPARWQPEPSIFDQGLGLAKDPGIDTGRYGENAVINSLTGEWADINKKCLICMRPGAQPCAQCHSSWYCSEACRKLDLQAHQIFCKDFAWIPTRPCPEHYLGIVFHVDSDKPDLVWVKELPPSISSARPQQEDGGSEKSNDKESDGSQYADTDDGTDDDTDNDADDEGEAPPAEQSPDPQPRSTVSETDVPNKWLCWDSENDKNLYYVSSRKVTVRKSSRHGNYHFDDGRVIEIHDIKPDMYEETSRKSQFVTTLRAGLSASTDENFKTPCGPLLILGR